MEKSTILNQEAEMCNNEVNMGYTVRILREAKGKSFDRNWLARQLNISQEEVLQIENNPVIESEELLQKIASVLQCDVNFLKTFSINGEKHLHMEHNTFSPDHTEGNEIVNQNQGVNSQKNKVTNYNIPIEEYKEVVKTVTELSVQLALAKEKNLELENTREELKEARQKLAILEKIR